MSVAIVVVSHSSKVAEGVRDLAAQMAQGVPFEVAGGTDDGGIGTSYDRIERAVEAADAASSGAGVVVLCDLGSAVMTTETYLEFQDDDVRARVRLVDAPLVEGAIAAGVEAAAGSALDRVAEVAHAAWGRGEAQAPGASDSTTPAESTRREAEVRNPQGMHARPAALLVKTAASFDAETTIDGAPATSLLALMGLGLTQGSRVVIAATGPDAGAAVEAIGALFDDGFGESDRA